MKNMLLAGLAVLSLAACGEKDTICACIEAGNKLNEKQNALLETGTVTAADKQAYKSLEADKKKKCAEFERMGGDEMKKRMQDCQ